MIDVVSVANMRESDSYAVSHLVPAKELMRRAAQGIFRCGAPWAGKTTVFTGSGNNGGDGYALAWILRSYHFDVTVVSVSDHVSETSGIFRDLCEKSGVSITYFPEDLSSDTIVDCLLGTGSGGAPRTPYCEAISAINSSGARIISADINSGMNGDTGEYELCVRSDLTVAIGYLKSGLIMPEAKAAVGSLAVADIGIPLLKKEREIDEESLGIRVISSLD